MPGVLKVSVGQHSSKGRKEINQDIYGFACPKEPLLSSKGVAVALADGIGSSEVSQVASEFAVAGLLDDYYCTSEAWSVKKSVERVLNATNSWLHSRTHQSQYRYEKDRGYVCTLSALVIKASTAHIFHVGDTRIYRIQGNALEQLTHDHRVWVGEGQSYLSRAIGINPQVEIDYRALNTEEGDTFLLATDGVYEHVDPSFMADAVLKERKDLDCAAHAIVEEALRRGSEDNLTVQIVAIDELPDHSASSIYRQSSELVPPPELDARATIDGYRIVRKVHASNRSHIYLALDSETQAPVIIKTPSVDLQADPTYLERFLMEEWIARRINSAHVVKPCEQRRKREYLYVATEYIEGQTLSQWMIDNPRPSLDTVRGIVEQIAKGLQAFHRLEMLHQDLRPDNIMIDRTGTVKIIDFGATRVAGITEMTGALGPGEILGTAQYTAPEYFLGQAGSERSDLFSLGVITYHMLSGRLPYGPEVAKSRTVAAQKTLQYASVLHNDREIPAWIDGVLRKAVQPDPLKRYETLSEFVYDLRHPNSEFMLQTRPPLLDRDPVMFWKTVSAILTLIILLILLVRFDMPSSGSGGAGAATKSPAPAQDLTQQP
jgi:serine/threonine protein kinase/serine/threonine protein phosphatase PrpC